MAEKELYDLFSPIVQELISTLCSIADENNYDRDSFVKALAKMLEVMSEICTFKKGGENNG